MKKSEAMKSRSGSKKHPKNDGVKRGKRAALRDIENKVSTTSEDDHHKAIVRKKRSRGTVKKSNQITKTDIVARVSSIESQSLSVRLWECAIL